MKRKKVLLFWTVLTVLFFSTVETAHSQYPPNAPWTDRAYSDIQTECQDKRLIDMQRLYYNEEHETLINISDAYAPSPYCTGGPIKIVGATIFRGISPERWAQIDRRPIIRLGTTYPKIVKDDQNDKLKPIYDEIIEEWIDTGRFNMTLDHYCRLMKQVDPSDYGSSRADHFKRRMDSGCIRVKERPNAPIMVDFILPFTGVVGLTFTSVFIKKRASKNKKNERF
jgi:hypothetical protein